MQILKIALAPNQVLLDRCGFVLQSLDFDFQFLPLISLSEPLMRFILTEAGYDTFTLDSRLSILFFNRAK